MNIQKRLKNGEHNLNLIGIVKTFKSKMDKSFTRENVL